MELPTDNSPSYIMGFGAQHHIGEIIGLAKAMAEKSYPHLLEDIKRKEEFYRKELLEFNGKQNIPSNAHKAF